MIQINMRKLFPELFPADYEKDFFVSIDIPENEAEEFKASLTKEIATIYIEDQREENAYKRRIYWHQAHYSLDRGDGIENDAVNATADPFDEYIKKSNKEQIHTAILNLPEKQAKCVYMKYILGFSQVEIAKENNISESAVSQCIERGFKNLEKILKSFY